MIEKSLLYIKKKCVKSKPYSFRKDKHTFLFSFDGHSFELSDVYMNLNLSPVACFRGIHIFIVEWKRNKMGSDKLVMFMYYMSELLTIIFSSIKVKRMLSLHTTKVSVNTLMVKSGNNII